MSISMQYSAVISLEPPVAFLTVVQNACHRVFMPEDGSVEALAGPCSAIISGSIQGLKFKL